MDPDAWRDLFSLAGKTALITGGSSGIGEAIAAAFAAAGAAVVICSYEAGSCEAVAARLRGQGAQATSAPCDVADKAQVEVLAGDLLGRGPVDILVHSAGIAGPRGSLSAVSDEDYDRVMEVNLRSAVRLTSLFIPPMAERGDGCVILVSSLSALRGNKAIGLYGLSKAALAQLARNLAVEWGPHNVRANAIAPGLIRTLFSKGVMADAPLMERRLGLTPLRRMGEPEEIAGAAVFLASRAGGFVTGHTLVVDGGTLITDGG
jgi:NAD(P)-dependent dehydrogenase (short-subunit alcohol dehydrogenase family)